MDSYLFGYPAGVRSGGVFRPAVSSTRSGRQPPEAGSGPLSDRQHALWLENLTTGQEEMPFVMEDGEQRFLYGDII